MIPPDLTPVSVESVRSAPVRLAPVRFASARTAPVRFASARSAPVRDESRVTVGRDLHLIAVHATLLVAWRTVTANLTTRVQVGIDVHLEFQLKISVMLIRTEKRVGTTGRSSSHNGAIFDLVSRRTVDLRPTK